MSPTPPPEQKQTLIPGGLFGILLALIQLALVFLSAPLGFPLWVNNGPALSPVIGVILLLYLVIPVLFALLVTLRTQQWSLGYRIGMLSGISCAIILVLVTAIALLSLMAMLANPPLGTSGSRLGSGGYIIGGVIAIFVFSLLVNGLGAALARLGASLGSGVGKRWSALEKNKDT